MSVRRHKDATRHAVIDIGENRFINDDAVRGAKTYIADGSVDLLITDPPYGINGDRLHQHYNRDERFVVGDYIEVPASEYNMFSRSWIAQVERILRPGGQAFIVSGYTNLYDILDALRKTRLREINHIIWKYNFGVYTTTKFVSSHYHILYYAKPGGKRTFNLQARYATNEESSEGGSNNYRDREDVWIINREYKPGEAKNKNELPHALLQKITQYASNEGDLVCDLFMGGCSTAAVAIGLNRRFIGIELSKATFQSRVPMLREIKPGDFLADLRTPDAHVVPNRGKAWDSKDTQKLVARFRQMRSAGVRKGKIVEALSEEFGRGSWSIIKLLKRLEENPIEVVAAQLSFLAAEQSTNMAKEKHSPRLAHRRARSKGR